MTSVPPIDRSLPIYRDDPVISRLTDEQVWQLANLLAQLAQSYATQVEARAEAEGLPAEEILRRDAEAQR